MHEDELNSRISDAKVVRRGFDKNDDKWFSEKEVLRLQTAQQELEWLLGRGYKTESVMNLIGGHYQFSARQRNALQRATSSKESYTKRWKKQLPYYAAKDGAIYIDGFNLIITLEVALSESILILGNDGTIRDIAGLRGSYSIIDKTDKALELIGKVFDELKVPHTKFFLDAPVSNSGRLKARILEHASNWGVNVEVELVQNADPILSSFERVITSDSIVLDNCKSWFNLAKKIVEDYIKDARVVNLSGNKERLNMI